MKSKSGWSSCAGVKTWTLSGLQKWQKIAKKATKKTTQPPKNWSFAWKIRNRPTYCDFEIYVLNPQLHQIFIPI